MTNFSRKGVLALLVLVLALAPGLVMAQGLGQTFEWPEKGLTISYPDGWTLQDMGGDQYALLSDPSIDVNAGPPSSPAILILTFPPDLVAALGDPSALLGMLTEEFAGTGALEPEAVMIAGTEALRVALSNAEENIAMDIVLISTDSNTFVIVGATPLGQEGAFQSTYDAMLNSIVLSTPTGPTASAIEAGMMFSGVRITLDQTITSNWNEIDAVELVGADADGLELNQWAIAAEATSSYGADSWSAAQATGAPDTDECGDYTTAWASATYDGLDVLTLTYGLPVAVSEVNIYQTYNPGAITMVELLPAEKNMEPVVIFEGVDSTTECPGVLSIPVSLTGGDSIAVGETVSGEITDMAPAQDWMFDAMAGDVVTITMVATGAEMLDTYLYLLDSHGMEIATNDDAEDSSVGGFNSQIAGFVIPADGTYTIRASRYDNTGNVGSYDLTLEAGTTGGGSTLDFSLAPSYGEVGLVSGFAPDPYAVEMTSGGPVDVNAAVGSACVGFAGYAASAPDFRLQYTAGSFNLRFFFASEGDTTMAVNAPDGSWYCDDDSGGSLQPLLTFEAPLSGQYDIWVGSFSPGELYAGTLYITEQNITADDVK